MTNDQLGQLTLAIALLLLTATVLGQLFARLRQPKVIGEILAGVLFGPSILGQIAPDFAHDVFGLGADAPTTGRSGSASSTSSGCCS